MRAVTILSVAIFFTTVHCQMECPHCVGTHCVEPMTCTSSQVCGEANLTLSGSPSQRFSLCFSSCEAFRQTYKDFQDVKIKCVGQPTIVSTTTKPLPTTADRRLHTRKPRTSDNQDPTTKQATLPPVMCAYCVKGVCSRIRVKCPSTTDVCATASYKEGGRRVQVAQCYVKANCPSFEMLYEQKQDVKIHCSNKSKGKKPLNIAETMVPLTAAPTLARDIQTTAGDLTSSADYLPSKWSLIIMLCAIAISSMC